MSDEPKELQGKSVRFKRKGEPGGQINQGKKRGRPRKSALKALQDFAYTPEEIKLTFAAIATMARDEIEDLIDNPDASVLELAASKAFQKAISKGDFGFIKDMVILFTGKPTSRREVETKAEIRVISLGEGLKPPELDRGSKPIDLPVEDYEILDDVDTTISEAT